LQAVDPATAARLAPNDSQRIGRALEVWTLTGQPLSAFHQDAKPVAPAWQIPVISLEPRDRAWLHARIAQRFDTMLASGFLDEVRALRARGDLHPDLPSMRCVGYRQAWQGLAEGWSETEIRERGIFATRQLAKRQLTWLRSMPGRTVVAADSADALAQACQTGLGALQGRLQTGG
jgi:tRNA dimethylallyltransferase